ncbi:MAG: hypothetical protein H7Z40_13005 [Phycisphaerae bacterium]|nr:hypothetical protein [Gemmatimonadaceae bacterium]
MLQVAHHPLYSPTIPIHAALATLAIVAGAVALLSRKGGTNHSRAGTLYATMIGGVVLTGALLIMTGAWSIRLLVLLGLTSFSTFSGIRVLRRKKPHLDVSHHARRLDWMAATVACAIGAGATLASSLGVEPANARAIYSTAPLLMVYGAYDLWRFARPTAWLAGPQLWLGEHITKMCGAYFGAMSALSGAYFTFIPMPNRIILPNVIGFLLTIILLYRMRRRRAQRSRAAQLHPVH